MRMIPFTLDSEIFEKLKQTFGIDHGVEERLKQIAEHDKDAVQNAQELFYHRIIKYVNVDDESSTSKLLASLEGYIERMVSGPWDEAYLQSRIDLAYRLMDAHLLPEHFKSALLAATEVLIEAIEKLPQNKKKGTIIALQRIATFDGSIIVRTFAHEATNRYRKSAETYRTTIDAMHDGMVVIDADDDTIVDLNKRTEVMVGSRREKLIGQKVFSLFPVEFKKDVEKAMARAKHEDHGLIPEIYLLDHLSGKYRPVEVSYARYRLDEEHYLVQIVRDIGDRLSIQRKLQRMNRLYRVLSSINELIVRSISKENMYKEVTRIIVEEGGFKFAWIAELADDELSFKPVAFSDTSYFYDHIQETLPTLTPDTIKDLHHLLEKEGYQIDRDPDSDIYKVIIPIWKRRNHRGLATHTRPDLYAVLKIYTKESEILGKEEIALFKEIADDISYAITTIEHRETIDFLENFDILTHLANRRFFETRLDLAVQTAHHSKEAFAVILLDIDQFKHINETYGFGTGDQILIHIAQQIERLVSPQDVVARYGSDEFAILRFDVKSEEALHTFAHKVVAIGRSPISIANQSLYLNLSLGISVFPKSAQHPGDLITTAEAALTRSKELGGNMYTIFSSEMEVEGLPKIKMMNELYRAFERNEFELYYQPQVSLETGEVIGAEALIRWHHPQRGLVSPGEFIPLLEESSLIEKVGLWVVEEACRQIALWERTQLRIPITIAVNMSAKQISRDKNIFNTIIQKVEEARIDPALLHVEITESVIMENLEDVMEGLALLNSHGILSAIDDFGTGYSSLAYLKKLPVFALKIDREFIKDLPDDKEDMSIVQAIVALAKNLGKKTIAEGVETDAQLRIMKKIGCDIIQGFYFGRPMPAKEFEDFYRNFEVSKAL